MKHIPSADEIQAALGALDDLQSKIAGALMPVMFRDASRVRDREWMAEQFASVAMLALDLGKDVEGKDIEGKDIDANVALHT